jgi:hypothetical protein
MKEGNQEGNRSDWRKHEVMGRKEEEESGE